MRRVSLLFSIILVALSIGCEKNEEQLTSEPIQQAEEPPNITAELVSLSTIPGIVKRITAKAGESRIALQAAKKGDSEFWLNEEEIVKVTDSVGNITYSIRIETSDPSATTIYNLIATERVDGVPVIPFVMRYEFENGDRFDYAGQTDKYFEGTTDLFTLEAFSRETGLSAAGTALTLSDCPEHDAFGDPISSNSTTASSGGSSGGGGSSSGYAPSSGYSYGGGRSTVYVSYGGSSGSTGSVEVGEGSFGEFGTDGAMERKSAATDPCPEGVILLPLNVEPLKIDLTELDDLCIKTMVQKLSMKDTKHLVSPDPGEIAGTSHLSQMVLDMFNDSEDWELKFVVAEAGLSNGIPVQANTDSDPNPGTMGHIFTITIDDDYARNATRVALQRTLIHESTHAFISMAAQTNATSSMATDLYNYKTQWIADHPRLAGQANNVSQHQLMAEYAEAIGHSLRIADNYRQDQSWYTAMGWSGGMIKDPSGSYTGAFMEKYPTQAQRTTVENIHLAEGTAASSATRAAKGTKCP